VTNTQAYYGTKLITAIKCFMIRAYTNLIDLFLVTF
jgi:hypothetical protein